MKTGRIAAAIGMVVGGALAAQSVLAQTVPFPTAARRYQAWMVRAMDQCSASTVSVVGTGLPSNGCAQTNATTDSEITMKVARLTISKATGKMALFGRGFVFGNRVSARLTLRVTKQGQATSPAPGSNSVTFTDATIMCPNAPFWFVARQAGTLAGSIKLSDCLQQNGDASGLSTGNIEILDAELVNIDSGKVFARPGILR